MKTTCVAKGLDGWVHEKKGCLVYKFSEPPPSFETQAPVFRWGKAQSDPTHRFDEETFRRLKKEMGPREAMARSYVVRK